MTEQLKQLIEHADTRLTGKAKIIMLVPTGDYDGFWGYNGYQEITVLWTDKTKDPDTDDYIWHIGGACHDVVELTTLFNTSTISIDFDNRYLVPRLFYSNNADIIFDNTLQLSAFCANVEGE